MQDVFATRALTPDGWKNDVVVQIDDGLIAGVQSNQPAPRDTRRVDTLFPALGNLHSHSFQRAMAGMTEFRAPGRDSFWTWRTLMYQFVDRLTPDQVEAIAALTFMEMQEAGYGAVGEFHYLHNQSGGAPYDAQNALSERIFAAAKDTGIGLTHLPVLYSYGGAGQQPLTGGQQRFANSIDSFAALVALARKSADAHMPEDTVVGIAPHSLRATCPDDLRQVLSLAQDQPIHIHIAEQPKEVAEIENWLGARPVEWLLNTVDVTDQWCLIHATHMTQAETIAMAASGAVAGLCPITEANLGDGPFNGPAYLAAGGRFGIGSDSNVRISLTEELRTLEYSQRLRDLNRNVFIADKGSVGAYIYAHAAQGGAQALGRNAGRISQGYLADLVAIDTTHPALCALREDQILDGLSFAADDRVVTDVWSAGRHQVKGGCHINRDAIVKQFRAAMTELLASI